MTEAALSLQTFAYQTLAQPVGFFLVLWEAFIAILTLVLFVEVGHGVARII